MHPIFSLEHLNILSRFCHVSALASTPHCPPLHFNVFTESFLCTFVFLSTQGVILPHNTSARVIRSNQSLVLQKVTRNSSGNYTCSAVNTEGETVSNQLQLRVKCKYEHEQPHLSGTLLTGPFIPFSIPFQMPPFASRTRWSLSVHSGTRTWTLFAKFLLIHRQSLYWNCIARAHHHSLSPCYLQEFSLEV